jgi:imidazolonepropionase-like amidohydrolase
VADRMGSLEKGKDADLVVLSGEPHDLTTRVEKVMIGGRWVFGENR